MNTSSTYDQILASGHFDAGIKPGPHDATRLTPGQLEDFLRRHTVRMRGWPLPFIDSHQPVRRHGTWISQEYAGLRHKEAWRLFTSGQFLHRRVLVSDLVDHGELAANATGATGSVVVWDVLLYAVELVELAARFATDLACDHVTINFDLANIEGRQLISGEWARELYGPYIISTDRLEARRRVTTSDLLADPRGVAVSIAQDLLGQFGLNVPEQVLMDWQEQTFRRA
jgi:hypothetical protein